MPDDVFPVDTGVAAFITLVGLTAYMVEHVLLGERHRDSGLRLIPLLPHLTCAHSSRIAVGAGSKKEGVLSALGPKRAGDPPLQQADLLCSRPCSADHLIEEEKGSE